MTMLYWTDGKQRFTQKSSKQGTSNRSEHDALLKINFKLGKIVGRKVEATDMLLGCHPKVQDCIDFQNKVGTKPVLLLLISF